MEAGTTLISRWPVPSGWSPVTKYFASETRKILSAFDPVSPVLRKAQDMAPTRTKPENAPQGACFYV